MAIERILTSVGLGFAHRALGRYLSSSGEKHQTQARNYIQTTSFKENDFSWSPLSHWHNRALKGVVDFHIGLTGSLALIPLSILLCPIIKITTKGPLLYHQAREGQYGKLFEIYKFRTMPIDTTASTETKPPSPGTTLAQRPAECGQLPSINRFLRSFLDEWPQFTQILFGQMSFIGPRPLLLRELNSVSSDQFFWRHFRQQIRPGMITLPRILTGGKQSNDEVIADDDFKSLEMWYLGNWSPWLDTKLFFRTVAVIASGRNH